MSAKSIADFQRVWRSMLRISLALFLPIASYAQDVSQNKDASNAKKPVLEVKLRMLTPTVCVGTPLKLRLEVTNVGQEVVKLNRAYFWNNYSMFLTSSESSDKDKERFFTHVWPRSTSEDILFLAPGKTYVAHTYWQLNEEWKSEPGNYTLEIITHGILNKAQFELHDCEQKN